MARATQKQLLGLEAILNSITGKQYELEWAYGRPRLLLILDEHGAAAEISPRLPTGQMATWLRAYIDGINVGRKL